MLGDDGKASKRYGRKYCTDMIKKDDRLGRDSRELAAAARWSQEAGFTQPSHVTSVVRYEYE